MIWLCYFLQFFRFLLIFAFWIINMFISLHHAKIVKTFHIFIFVWKAFFRFVLYDFCLFAYLMSAKEIFKNYVHTNLGSDRHIFGGLERFMTNRKISMIYRIWWVILQNFGWISSLRWIWNRFFTFFDEYWWLFKVSWD